MSKPIVAVVGRPNVGKSTLFNKIVGSRVSIVEDTPGVTRDRIYAEAEWSGASFILIDTGGIEPDSDDIILSQMREQAQIAIGSGGLFGKGLFQGTQHTLGILPEAPTDFIFCVLAEELGFFGVVVLLGLYLALVLVSFRIAGSAGDLFGLLIVMCVVGMWLFQILENIGMTCGLMPITGIPLPFMSYGSTGTIMNFIMLGLIGSVWAHNTATGKKGSYADTR